MRFLLLFFLPLLLYSYDIYKKGDALGHTLLIIGGIHGNEPGGYFAASTLIEHYTFSNGTVYIIPNFNALSIAHNSRGIHGDLNRKFDTIGLNDPDYAIVESLKKFINSHKIDLILNLHDGHGYYRDNYTDKLFNPNAWGQTCVIDKEKLDKNCTFSELQTIAKQIKQAINSNLLAAHHQFSIKNTHTPSNNPDMQKSLTYYCIKQGIPAFAIETSKNLKRVEEKLYYQLHAIENFLNIMHIHYKKSVNPTIKNLSIIIKNYGKVTINRNISLSLSNIRKTLSFVPLKSNHNDFNFSHPLGSVRKIKNSYALFVGNRLITTLIPERFKMGHCDKNASIIVDNKEKVIAIASTFSALSDFNVMKRDEIRVNIIGFSQTDLHNESGIDIAKNQMLSRYSIDRSGQDYRIEFYHDDMFCGMIAVNFLRE